MMNMSVILGIDPGSRFTGYGVLQLQNNQPCYLASGRIRLQQESLPQRLSGLYDALQSIVSEYQPSHVAIEKVFLGKNASSALKLGHARGVAMLVPSLHGIPVHEYAARLVKQAVAGTGAADKQQVQKMVIQRLNLSSKPSEDAADALAVALCHFQSYRMLQVAREASTTAAASMNELTGAGSL